MLLKKIKLNNFRQFYGVVVLEFDIIDGKNITVIHAENGVGKTALLNSVTWAFFEKLTSNFRKPKNLINDTAQSEGEKACNVEIEFEEGGTNFWLIRRYDSVTRKSIVRIRKMDGSTWGVDLPEPDRVINSILPKEMSEYFFFQGEGSNAVDAGNSQGNLAKSIRDILGFKVAENLLETLDQNIKKIRREISSLDKSGELTKLEDEHIRLEKILDVAKNKKNIATEKKPELEKELEEVNDQLLKINNMDLKRLKNDELQSTRELEKSISLRTKLKREKYQKIAKYGWAVFGADFAETSLDFIDESELKGRIPEPYNKQLIMDILSATQCICGRSLESGSEEYKKINSLLGKAANPELTKRLRGINGQISAIKTYSADAYKEISTTVSHYDDVDERIQSLELKIKNLRMEIEMIPEQDIAKLQKITRTLREDRDNQIRIITSAESQIERTSREIALNEMKKSQFTANTSVVIDLNKRRNFIQTLSDFLSSYLEKMEQDIRLHVLEEVNRTLQEFSRHDFKIMVSNNFEFVLLDKNKNEVGQGDGLNLLLNLTITTALINFAGQHKDVRDPILNSTTVAPLFIDAPFGVLDNKYRSVVVKELPKKVKQIVFLVSSSQWTDEMDSEIRDFINTEYCVILEESSPQQDKDIDKINICGREVIMSRYDCEKDRTTVEKVI